MNASRSAAPRWLDPACVAAVAIALLAVTWPRAVGFTTDSDAYLDVATNVLTGHGLVQRVVDFWRPGAPDPLGMWPPLYPLAVAALARTGLAVSLAARLVSALALVGFAVAFLALARRAGGRAFGLVTTLLALALPGLLGAGVTAWSESLYLALLTVGLVGAWDVGAGAVPGRGGGVVRAALAGIALGLAADTRYVGLALLPVVSVLLLLRSSADRRARLAWIAGALVAVLPWLVHNFGVFGHALGPARPAATRSAVATLVGIARATRWGFLPGALAHAEWVALPALVGVVIACAWALRRRGVEGWAAWTAVVQLAAVGLAEALSGMNAPEGRLTLVAWPFLLLATCAGARAALASRGTGDGGAARLLPALAALALVVSGVDVARSLAASPAPPAAAAVRVRELAALARLVPAGSGPVLSDAGHLVRLATDRTAVQVPPREYRVREFTADDERAWRERGVEWAVLRSANRGAWGDVIGQRTAGGAGAWAVEDSAEGFVRYRLAP